MILDKLAQSTRKRVELEKANIPLKLVKEKALNMPKGNLEFEKTLAQKGINFICEVKKASPSKGIIAEDFPYIEIAKEYEKAGASCISVLTEPEYFKGDKKYLKEISENVFPSEDIDELKKGVEFDNLDEAQQMFENFVS